MRKLVYANSVRVVSILVELMYVVFIVSKKYIFLGSEIRFQSNESIYLKPYSTSKTTLGWLVVSEYIYTRGGNHYTLYKLHVDTNVVSHTYIYFLHFLPPRLYTPSIWMIYTLYKIEFIYTAHRAKNNTKRRGGGTFLLHRSTPDELWRTSEVPALLSSRSPLSPVTWLPYLETFWDETTCHITPHHPWPNKVMHSRLIDKPLLCTESQETLSNASWKLKVIW